MRVALFLVLMVGWRRAGAPPAWAAYELPVVRDTLLPKDPNGPHVPEACRYYTEPFTVAVDPEQAGPHAAAGIGLRARADYLRGRVRTDSSARGTSIVVQIPGQPDLINATAQSYPD